jgi:peroxiredoxin
VELPRLEPLYRKYQDQGFEVIVIEAGGDRKRAMEFIAKNKLSYTCLENGTDDKEIVESNFQVTGFPTSYLIDGDGKVMYMHLGYDDGDDVKLEKEIQGLLSM